MQIRKMTAADVFVVADLEKRAFTMPWSVEAFKSALMSQPQRFVIAEENGEVVGYAGMMFVVDEGQLLNIAVEPDYRRRGIARSLINELIAYGTEHGATLYTLEVREHNTPARKLYASMGFREVGVRKDYYGEPVEDAILMDLDLSE